MIDIIIKILEKFTNFLKNLQLKQLEFQKSSIDWNQPKINYWIKSVFFVLLWSVVPVLTLLIYYENFYSNSNKLLIIILLIIVNLFFIYTLAKNQNWKYFFLIHFPLYLWLICVLWMFDKLFISDFWLYGIFMNSLLIIFPIIFILQYYIKFFRNKYVDIFKNIAYFYNIGFFLIITINVLLITLWFNLQFIQPWSSIIIGLLDTPYINWLFERILYILVVVFFVLYWVYTLHVYYDNIWYKRNNIHKALLFFLIVYCIWLTTTILSYFYDYQISRATEIISTEWNNYESYKDAKVLFLDRAFLSKIKRGEYIDETLFNKIYDNTISWYYWEKVSKYTRSSTSFSTDSSKIWDSAEVVLQLAEITNNVIETTWTGKVSILETTYKFHFTNETNQNQEVKLNFETPNKLSVVTSLKLWMDLQLIWQIAPRWAALKVYEDSLRKNIDPALIEKVWLNTYNLRVFPIPSKIWDTQWRQLVEVKMLTPITEENILYSPKFSFTNLKIENDSRLQSKIYNKQELIKEDVIKSNDIENYLSNDHILSSNELNINTNKKFSDILISHNVMAYICPNTENLFNQKNIWNKINVFFDNSQSVERNNANKFYKEIYNWIKNNNGKLNDVDLYSYNFDVTKITWVEDIKYWGFSDIDRTIDYIVNNNIKNEKVIFVTDDENFNLNTIENPNRNLEKLVTNNISVIKIWKNLKTYKSDFNTILSATNWNIYQIDTKEDILKTLEKILNNSNELVKLKECEKLNNDEDNIVVTWYNPENNDLEFTENWEIISDDKIEKIQAWIISNLLLWSIKNKNEWEKIAIIQTNIARKFWIVNQFNSLIALETSRQQNDLDRYEKSWSAYETTYDNDAWKIQTSFNRWAINSLPTVNFESDWAFDNSYKWWISPWMGVTWDLRTSRSSYWWSYDNSIGMSFSGRTEISFIWLLLFIIYIIEYGFVISFMVKYVKWEKNRE